jgi:hypothetical protein
MSPAVGVANGGVVTIPGYRRILSIRLGRAHSRATESCTGNAAQ